MSDGVRTLDGDGLRGALDWYRSIVVAKLAGLTREQATQHVMPSGTTALGVVKHLAWVEVEWFQQCVAGEAVDLPADVDEHVDASFQLDADDTPESVVRFYDSVCARSRQIVAERSLDDHTLVPHPYFGICTVEWVLYHLTRETAQHLGHLDILCEMTDGRTGYG